MNQQLSHENNFKEYQRIIFSILLFVIYSYYWCDKIALV